MSTPVSGPGRFSQRTDRQPMAQLPNADYGEQKAFKQLQQDAPMSASAGGGVPSGGVDLSQLFSGAAANVIPMDGQSTQPGVPVTSGADIGPGAGLEGIGGGPASPVMAAYLPALEFMANQPGSSDAARNLVRQIKYTL